MGSNKYIIYLFIFNIYFFYNAGTLFHTFCLYRNENNKFANISPIVSIFLGDEIHRFEKNKYYSDVKGRDLRFENERPQ